MASYSIAYVLPIRSFSHHHSRVITIIGHFHGNPKPLLVIAPRSVPVLRIVSKRLCVEPPPLRIIPKVIPYNPIISYRATMH